MNDLIVLRDDSSREVIDLAYQRMCEIYRDLIEEELVNYGETLDEVIGRRGCSNQELVRRFILDESPIPCAKDLERLSAGTISSKLTEKSLIVLGSGILPFTLLCGTRGINGAYNHVNPSEADIPYFEKMRGSLALFEWFLEESSRRYDG